MSAVHRVLIVVLVLSSSAAMAAGLGFLSKGPAAKFNDADHDLFRGALGRALATDAVGTPVAWKNPQTQASGEITPQKTFEDAGAPCRTLRVVSRYGTLESDGVYTMCKRQGRWQLKVS
jgi:surface antigen